MECAPEEGQCSTHALELRPFCCYFVSMTVNLRRGTFTLGCPLFSVIHSKKLYFLFQAFSLQSVDSRLRVEGT
jgi:hypothetical protein